MALHAVFDFFRGRDKSQGSSMESTEKGIARGRTAAVADAPANLPQKPAQTVPPAPSSASGKFQVLYHDDLVARLEQDHQVLLWIYGQVDTAIKADQWGDVAKLLLEFRSKLTDHLLMEGVKLYCYLQKRFQEDEEISYLFNSFKKEMNGIGKTVFSFVDAYAKEGALASHAAKTAFLVDFRAIGEVLIDRIQREEAQLYPMYIE